MSKSMKIILSILVGAVLLGGAFSGGILIGWALPGETASLSLPGFATPRPENTSAPSTDTETLFKPFWEAWDIVHEQYVDQPVDDLTLMQGAIRGMMESLGDKHTSYMDPEEYLQATTPLEGEYEGIGAWVDTSGDYLTITSPMPNSPAEQAGLKANDQIVAIDGKDMTGTPPDVALKSVLGPADTEVTLTIHREGEEDTFDVTITRSKIVIPSVESKMLEGDIAYIKLSTFGDKTSADLNNQLKDLMKQNPKGMILDLRNNGGGYLNTAIDVVSQFIPQGVVMYEEYGSGEMKEFKSKGRGLATEIPLVVLVNEGTASASEITAGAIQDFGRGQLVGMTTYGKGSVQNWIGLQDDQGAVRVTIARWLTPDKRQINEVGLTPDVEVEFTKEDFDAGRDPQLEKAIELLK